MSEAGHVQIQATENNLPQGQVSRNEYNSLERAIKGVLLQCAYFH